MAATPAAMKECDEEPHRTPSWHLLNPGGVGNIASPRACGSLNLHLSAPQRTDLTRSSRADRRTAQDGMEWMASFCIALDALPSPSPGAKRPVQEPHFQPLATVQNDPPGSRAESTACHSPDPGGRGSVFGGERLYWLLAPGSWLLLPYFTLTFGSTDMPGRSRWSLFCCGSVRSTRTGIRCTTFT